MTGFTPWCKWKDYRVSFKEYLKYPGVYALAVSENLEGKPFALFKDIKYFGMTNSQKGLDGRLRQFQNTIEKGVGHGGANRFIAYYKKEGRYKYFIDNLYVSIRPFECGLNWYKAEDLEIMGEIAQFEYYCIASYLREYKALPWFNDKQKYPKIY